MGDVAPDGSPVQLYAALEPLGEPELVHAAVESGAEILELGCGAGRITHALIALGHPVVAVDQSAEMLAHVHGAEKVLADIETLRLGRRFPVVLLASNFLNQPDTRERRSFLGTCAAHVQPEGRVLLERMPPDWEPRDGTAKRGGVRMTMRNASREGQTVAATMEYEVAGEIWTHAFTAVLLSDEELDDDLAAAGLERRRWLDESRSWLEAGPR